jgi:ketosteroid isomerase-like protein
MSRRIWLVTLALILLVTSVASGEPEDEIRAVFGRFVAAQNAHDLGAMRELLWDSTRFLWITRGVPVWGREAALKRFEAVYQGTWRLEPSMAELHVTMLSSNAGQLYVPILLTSGAAGQAGQSTRVLMNQTIVRTAAGWKVANIVPVPILVQAANARPPIVAIDKRP